MPKKTRKARPWVPKRATQIGDALSFGQVVQRLRQDARLQQIQVAYALGFKSFQSVAYIEQDYYLPNADVIPRLAEVLNVSEDYLYFAAGLVPPRIRAISTDYWPVVLGLTRIEQALHHDAILQREDPGLSQAQRCDVLSGKDPGPTWRSPGYLDTLTQPHATDVVKKEDLTSGYV